MKKIYFLNLCECGCNQIVYGNNRFVNHHHWKGRKHLDETKDKISYYRTGKNPWNKGLTKEDPRVKKNIESRTKSIKERGSLIGENNPFYGKHHSPETCKVIGEKQIRDKNHMWNGGTSFLPYCPKFNSRLREAIRSRDNHTCQLCNIPQNGRKHSVHHIHYDKENCYPDLICLCNKCNSKVNKISERKNYENTFMNKLNERGLLFWTSSFVL